MNIHYINKTLSACIISMTLASPAYATSYFFDGKPFSVQGHRGAKGLVGPGNTFSDIRAAIHSSVDSFETDLRRTADNVIVLGHDENIDLTCDYRGPGRPSTNRISRMTFAEQQLWDCEPQNPGIQPYPTLEQLLAFHQIDSFLFNLEIKPSDIATTDEIMERVIRYDQNCGSCLRGRLRLSSFNWNVLRHAQRTYSNRIDFSVAVLVRFVFPWTIRNAAGFADVFSPSFSSASASNIRSVQAAGMKFIPYTVNSERDMNTMLARGVDGMITDFPNRLAALVNSANLNGPLPDNAGRNLVANPSAEDTLATGQWTALRGQWSTTASIDAFQGDKVFAPRVDANGQAILEQTILLPTGVSREMFFRAYLGGGADSDQHRVRVEYLDSNDQVVFLFDTFALNVPANTWRLVRDSRVVPDTAVSARIRLIATRQSGSQAEVYFDNLFFGLLD